MAMPVADFVTPEYKSFPVRKRRYTEGTGLHTADAPIRECFKKWDSVNLLQGLTKIFPALMDMKKAWRDEPQRSLVLQRLKGTVETSKDAVEFPLLFIVSRKCYAQALACLGETQQALQVVEHVFNTVESPDLQVKKKKLRNLIFFAFD